MIKNLFNMAVQLLFLSKVKMSYVNFVNHCYVDTEVEMKEIYTSNHIWTLFENFILDMARVSIKVQVLFMVLLHLSSQKPTIKLQSWIVGMTCSNCAFICQVCNKREKRLPDATLEKYVLTVVLETIRSFFNSPFSENSTSLQVRAWLRCSCLHQNYFLVQWSFLEHKCSRKQVKWGQW